MHLDIDTLKYLLAVPLAWLAKILWSDHKDLQELRQEVAKHYPTRDEVDLKIKTQAADHKEDLVYIRSKVDMLVQREMDK
jgi:hypothetical protein